MTSACTKRVPTDDIILDAQGVGSTGNDTIRDEMRILLNGAFGPAAFRCVIRSLFWCPKKVALRCVVMGSSSAQAPKSHLQYPLRPHENPYVPQVDLNGGHQNALISLANIGLETFVVAGDVGDVGDVRWRRWRRWRRSATFGLRTSPGDFQPCSVASFRLHHLCDLCV